MCKNVYYIKFEFPYPVAHKFQIPPRNNRQLTLQRKYIYIYSIYSIYSIYILYIYIVYIYSGNERLIIKLWLIKFYVHEMSLEPRLPY